MNDPVMYRAKLTTLWVLCAFNAVIVYLIGVAIFG